MNESVSVHFYSSYKNNIPTLQLLKVASAVAEKSISINRKRDRNAKSHHQSFSFIDSKGPKIFTPVRKSKKQFASFEFQRKTVGGHFSESVGLQNSEADSTKFAKFVGCAVAE